MKTFSVRRHRRSAGARTSRRHRPEAAVAFLLGLALSGLGPRDAAAQAGAREGLDDYLGRLVTEIRASLPDLEPYEPFVVLRFLHDERGYRVQVSDLLERRFADALAAQGVRVLDPAARQRILDELEDCYEEEAPFCRAADLAGRFQVAGGILEGSVLPLRTGTELRVKLVDAGGVGDLSPGEIVGTWRVVVPPPIIDPVEDLSPAAGAVSYGVAGVEGVRPLGELRVDVRTRDDTPAWVNIDGEVNVPAPVTTTAPAGRHLLTVTASGHKPFSGYVEVPPRGTVSRQIVLSRGEGQIWVRSSALQAHVLLDGARVGTTPWRGRRIETGRHTVRIEREGYEPHEVEFVLEHEEVKDIYAELRELPGDIVVTCLHDDIAVFIDEAARGPVGTCGTERTLTVADLPAGRHTVWGARGDDRTSRENVIVRGGEAVPVSLRLLLELPDDYREANRRRESEREIYEPFGGRGWGSGLYLSVGGHAGRVELDLGGPAETYEVLGLGGRLAAALLLDPWQFDVAFDLLYLDDFADFAGTRRYHEVSLGTRYYFLRGSAIRPFVGLRGHYNGLSLDEGGDGAELTAGGFGGGVTGGATFQLGSRGLLSLGASFSYSLGGDLESKTTGDRAGDLDRLGYVSGFATAALRIGPN